MKDKKVLSKVGSKVTESFINNKRKESKGTGMVNYDDEDDIDISVNKNLKSKFNTIPINSKSKLIQDDLDLLESVNNDSKQVKSKEVGTKQLPYVINYHTISNNMVFMSYLDTNCKTFYQEIGLIKDKKFKMAIEEYLKKRSITKKDSKLIEIRWDLSHPKDQDEEESENSEVSQNYLKPIEAHFVPIEKEKHELGSMEKQFNKIFHELVNSQKTEYEKHLVALNEHVISVDYSKKSYNLKVDYDSYFRDKEVSKRMRESIMVSPVEMYHPTLIFNMHQHAMINNVPGLLTLAEHLFTARYPKHLIDIERRMNIINGSKESKTRFEDYIKYTRVAKFITEGKHKKLENVYGFRRQLPLLKQEGYLKYYYNREKSQFIYFSYDDIYELFGQFEGETFLNSVHKTIENEESLVKTSVETLKFKTRYKKGKIHNFKRMTINRTVNYRTNNDCFYDSLMMVTNKEIKFQFNLRDILRNKTLDQQIDIIEKGDYGIVLDMQTPETIRIKDKIEQLENKCLVVIDVGHFKSHTIPFIPGIEIEDSIYNEFKDEFARVTVIDVWE